MREDAKTIAEKTGKAGFATMTINNTGGWQLTAQTISRGAEIQKDNGDGTYTSTLNNDGTKAALEYFHDLRWDDNSMGSNFLLDWGTINQEFGAGNIGMYTRGSDVYTSLVRDFSLNPDDYGLTVLPTEGDDAGVLGGGDIAVMSPTIDDAHKAAAVKWIDLYYMQKLLNEDAARADAKALVASDQAVGTPVLPVLDKANYEKSLEWIKPYVNVPADQMAGFFDGIFDAEAGRRAEGQDPGGLRAARHRHPGSADRRERRHRRPPHAGRQRRSGAPRRAVGLRRRMPVPSARAGSRHPRLAHHSQRTRSSHQGHRSLHEGTRTMTVTDHPPVVRDAVPPEPPASVAPRRRRKRNPARGCAAAGLEPALPAPDALHLHRLQLDADRRSRSS